MQQNKYWTNRDENKRLSMSKNVKRVMINKKIINILGNESIVVPAERIAFLTTTVINLQQHDKKTNKKNRTNE